MPRKLTKASSRGNRRAASREYEHALLTAIIAASDDAILSRTPHGIITSWNAAAERMFGYTADEIIGRSETTLFPPDRLYEEDIILDRLGHGIPTDHFETIQLHKNGTPIHVSVTISPIKGAAGETIAASVTIRDITERRHAEHLKRNLALSEQESAMLESRHVALLETNARLEYAVAQLELLAATDGLTGLNNHREFQARFKEAYDHTVRYHSPLSVVLLDLDGFKEYNDTHGHPAGDNVLRQIGKILEREARSTDIVARYGGEEFVLILPETEAEEARHLAERLRQAIGSAPLAAGRITASFGVSTFHLLLKNAVTLLEEADKALYRSKRRGRDCVTHFIDALEDGTGDMHALESVHAVVQSDLVGREEIRVSVPERNPL